MCLLCVDFVTAARLVLDKKVAKKNNNKNLTNEILSSAVSLVLHNVADGEI